MVEVIKRKFEDNSVNVVFSSNNKYAYYLIVALHSLLMHVSAEKKYDIIILETDIEPELKNLISGMQKENVSIRLVNTEIIFNEIEIKNLFCHLHYTKEMYLRIFIPELLQDYDKAVYIDCDTIIQADVSELYDIDVNDYFLGVIKDFNIIVNYTYLPNVKSYFDDFIHIPDINSYFNSGVLLMNLNKLREMPLRKKAFECLSQFERLFYPDQDVLNLICAGKVKFLNNGWNFAFAINPALVQNNVFIPLALEWTKGLANQKIIHYTSEIKPWNGPEMAYSDIWWGYAKETPVYQKLLKDYFTAHPEKLKKE